MDIHLQPDAGNQTQQQGYLLSDVELSELSAEFNAYLDGEFDGKVFSSSDALNEASDFFLGMSEFFANENKARKEDGLPALEQSDIKNVLDGYFSQEGMSGQLTDDQITTISGYIHDAITLSEEEFMAAFYDGFLMWCVGNLTEQVKWVQDAGKD